MPKIQNVGIGNFIRNPRGRAAEDSRGMSVEILQVARSDGNSFLCYPVTGYASGVATLDTTRYQQIPIDTQVQQVTP